METALAFANLWRVADEESRGPAESTEDLLAIIEQINRGAVRAVPLLIAALRDADGAVREAAANALGRIGPEAKDALPGLSLLFDDKDELVRDAAREAIARIETGLSEL